MNCHDARESFAALIIGGLRLTEWAPVEAHVSQCTECGQLLEHLYQMRPRHRAGRLCAPAGVVSNPLEPAHLPDVAMRPRRQLLLRTVLSLSTGVAAVMLVTALTVFILKRSSEPQVSALQGAPSGTYRAEIPPGEPTLTQPIPRTSTPPAESGGAHVTSGGGGSKQSPASASALPPPAEPPAAKVKNESTTKHSPAPAAVSRPVPAPGIASTITPGRNEARPSEGVGTAPPARPESASESVSPARASTADVLVQLSVRDRSAAKRDVTTLLTGLGGTQLGRDQGFTIMVVLPRSSYGEFTRGLAQIGSWQMEPGPSSLPDPVHVAVRLVR